MVVLIENYVPYSLYSYYNDGIFPEYNIIKTDSWDKAIERAFRFEKDLIYRQNAVLKQVFNKVYYTDYIYIPDKDNFIRDIIEPYIRYVLYEVHVKNEECDINKIPDIIFDYMFDNGFGKGNDSAGLLHIYFQEGVNENFYLKRIGDEKWRPPK